MSSILQKNIIIDQEAFEIAAKDFSELAEDVEALKNKVKVMLSDLGEGFDTPAGRKFISSCQDNLLQPMIDLALIVNHVSDNLTTAKGTYASVFKAYDALNSTINNFNQ